MALEQQRFSKAEVEILKSLAKIEANQEIILDSYVTQKEFEPVKKLVYGLAALILVAFTSGLVALVLQ